MQRTLLSKPRTLNYNNLLEAIVFSMPLYTSTKTPFVGGGVVLGEGSNVRA